MKNDSLKFPFSSLLLQVENTIGTIVAYKFSELNISFSRSRFDSCKEETRIGLGHFLWFIHPISQAPILFYLSVQTIPFLFYLSFCLYTPRGSSSRWTAFMNMTPTVPENISVSSWHFRIFSNQKGYFYGGLVEGESPSNLLTGCQYCECVHARF